MKTTFLNTKGIHNLTLVAGTTFRTEILMARLLIGDSVFIRHTL